MGKIAKARPVKLITGFIFKDNAAFKKAKILLKQRFGKIDFESQTLPFNLTDYYKKEFGDGLKRVFISFRRQIPPQELSKIKVFTNQIEKKISCGKNRLVNIDPGYLDLAKLILASTKDYVHRIYLDKGIYAEITLFYQDKSFKPWTWTYPDYRTPEYIAIFNHIREIYAQ
ncbi:MAG: DUF4416 family protein [Candidatus Omnitrophica bacterium]|nr:DUF4416 family protein [Candidatus Omnitrophota bacterium]